MNASACLSGRGRGDLKKRVQEYAMNKRLHRHLEVRSASLNYFCLTLKGKGINATDPNREGCYEKDPLQKCPKPSVKSYIYKQCICSGNVCYQMRSYKRIQDPYKNIYVQYMII